MSEGGVAIGNKISERAEKLRGTRLAGSQLLVVNERFYPIAETRAKQYRSDCLNRDCERDLSTPYKD